MKLKAGQVGAIINRFVSEMNGTPEKPGVKPLGESHRCTILVMAGMPIGAKDARTLEASDVQDMVKALAADGLSPATCNQYVVYLSGALKYAGSAWADCKGVNGDAVKDAKPYLKKYRLIGKSQPRERRPTDDELERRRILFEQQAQSKRARIDMARMDRWQIASGRRVGESCRLRWEHWDREAQTILVTKMKDPRTRNKNKVVALPNEAQAMLVELYETRDPNEPRIFPYNPHSVSARSTEANRKLGIVGLRLHDSRRETSSRLVEQGYSPTQAILVTGHETTAIFERTYMKNKPEHFHRGPASKQA